MQVSRLISLVRITTKTLSNVRLLYSMYHYNNITSPSWKVTMRVSPVFEKNRMQLFFHLKHYLRIQSPRLPVTIHRGNSCFFIYILTVDVIFATTTSIFFIFHLAWCTRTELPQPGIVSSISTHSLLILKYLAENRPDFVYI